MNEPIDKEQCLNIADQCATTASNDITALILVDGGSGTLRQLLNDAADAIRAGWRAQPTAEGGIKWQCGPLASGFTAPQPSPTAQAADSQPAPDEIINMAREQGLPETEIEGVFRVNADDLCRVAAAILAARAPADSTPAWASQAVIEYRYTGGTHWCQLGPAERMKSNFDGVYRLQGGVFPVDAPADSMTAPASGEVAGWLPVHSNGHKFYGAPLKTEAEAKQYINQVHQSSDSVTLIVRPFTWIATPPTQGADIVMEDAARYRWLRLALADRTNNGKSHWFCSIAAGRPEELDAAIDAARKQGGE